MRIVVREMSTPEQKIFSKLTLPVALKETAKGAFTSKGTSSPPTIRYCAKIAGGCSKIKNILHNMNKK